MKPVGANSSVSIEEFKQNLVDIVTHLIVQAYNPNLILLTPPMGNERHMQEHALGKSYLKLPRTNDVTSTYAAAVREVAHELDTACVDLFTAFSKPAG